MDRGSRPGEFKAVKLGRHISPKRRIIADGCGQRLLGMEKLALLDMQIYVFSRPIGEKFLQVADRD
ncbi:hypothetical protein D3C80_2128800 [compost metagenome]